MWKTALRADRKRLKAEKFELLNQMKQLYATLEDKDKELRDFIRNYEQVIACAAGRPFYSVWGVSGKEQWLMMYVFVQPCSL